MKLYIQYLLLLTFLSCNSNSNDIVTSGITDEVTEYYSKGKIKSIRNYKNGKLNGKSVEFFENGKISSIVYFYDEKFISKGLYYYPNGNLNFEEERDSLGRGIGIFKLWYESKEIKQIGLMKKGKMEGKWLTYFKNGSLKSVENYESGLKHGDFLIFSETGDTIKQEKYYGDTVLN